MDRGVLATRRVVGTSFFLMNAGVSVSCRETAELPAQDATLHRPAKRVRRDSATEGCRVKRHYVNSLLHTIYFCSSLCGWWEINRRKKEIHKSGSLVFRLSGLYPEQRGLEVVIDSITHAH